MKKLISILLILVMLTGCQLATDETVPDDTVQDRLVGVVVTWEYLDLFDMEAYLNDHLDEVMEGDHVATDTAAYQGCIYARETVQEQVNSEGEKYHYTEYDFDQVEGIALISYQVQVFSEDGELNSSYFTSIAGEGIQDVCFGTTSMDLTGDAYGVKGEGTIYIPNGSGEISFYTNPVYQDSEGRLYLVPGSGMSSELYSGGMSTWVTEERTITRDGEEVTEVSEFVINVQGVDIAETVTLVQMDGENQVLSRVEYGVDALPDAIEPEEGCAYIIVEEVCGSETRRTIAEPGDKEVPIYNRGDQAFCQVHCIGLCWNEE